MEAVDLQRLLMAHDSINSNRLEEAMSLLNACKTEGNGIENNIIFRFVLGLYLRKTQNDDDARKILSSILGLTQTGFGYYCEGGLYTERNHDFLDEPRFIAAAEERYNNTPHAKKYWGKFRSRWNLHVVLWAAEQALASVGDIVQLGVFEGSEAAAIAKYTDFQTHGSRRMFLVDTYTGNPPGMWTEDEIRMGANSAQWAYLESGNVYEYVKDKFKGYNNIHVIQGVVPDILPQVETDKVSLLLIDMNCAAPERAGLEYFWDKIVSGGIILCDDYGHSKKDPNSEQGFYAQKLSFDEFAASRKVPVLTLPTGHGMIVKP